MSTIHATVAQLDHSASRAEVRSHRVTIDRPVPKGGQHMGRMQHGAPVGSLNGYTRSRAGGSPEGVRDVDARAWASRYAQQLETMNQRTARETPSASPSQRPTNRIRRSATGSAVHGGAIEAVTKPASPGIARLMPGRRPEGLRGWSGSDDGVR
jgi:hypothetical protein